MTDAMEPPLPFWEKVEPSSLWLLLGLSFSVSPRTDIGIRAVDLEVESAPRRSDADAAASVAALPELSTSFFPALALAAEAAHDVLPSSTAADATKRRLARGIPRRMVGVFSFFVEDVFSNLLLVALLRTSSPRVDWARSCCR